MKIWQILLAVFLFIGCNNPSQMVTSKEIKVDKFGFSLHIPDSGFKYMKETDNYAFYAISEGYKKHGGLITKVQYPYIFVDYNKENFQSHIRSVLELEDYAKSNVKTQQSEINGIPVYQYKYTYVKRSKTYWKRGVVYMLTDYAVLLITDYPETSHKEVISTCRDIENSFKFADKGHIGNNFSDYLFLNSNIFISETFYDGAINIYQSMHPETDELATIYEYRKTGSILQRTDFIPTSNHTLPEKKVHNYNDIGQKIATEYYNYLDSLTKQETFYSNGSIKSSTIWNNDYSDKTFSLFNTKGCKYNLDQDFRHCIEPVTGENYIDRNVKTKVVLKIKDIPFKEMVFQWKNAPVTRIAGTKHKYVIYPTEEDTVKVLIELKLEDENYFIDSAYIKVR